MAIFAWDAAFLIIGFYLAVGRFVWVIWGILILESIFKILNRYLCETQSHRKSKNETNQT